MELTDERISRIDDAIRRLEPSSIPGHQISQLLWAEFQQELEEAGPDGRQCFTLTQIVGRHAASAWCVESAYSTLLDRHAAADWPEPPIAAARRLADRLTHPLAKARFREFVLETEEGRERSITARLLVRDQFAVADWALTRPDWCSEFEECLHRACSLALSLGFSATAWDGLELLTSAIERRRDNDPWHTSICNAAAELGKRDKSSRRPDLLISLRSAQENAATANLAAGRFLAAKASAHVSARLSEALGDRQAQASSLVLAAEASEAFGDSQLHDNNEGSAWRAALHYNTALTVLNAAMALCCADAERARFVRLKSKVVQANLVASSELTVHTSSVAIEQAEIAEVMNRVVQAPTPSDRIDALLGVMYVPDVAAEDAFATRQVEESVVFRLASTQLIEDGRPVGGPLTCDEQIRHDARRMRALHLEYNAELIFKRALLQMLSDGSLAPDDLLTAFGDRGLVSAERAGLLRSGIIYLATGHYAAAVHLLVPQFEDALRRLMGAAQRDTLRFKDGRYEHATLDALIDEAAVELGDGFAELFRVAFTAYGRRLRHRVCHGLASALDCGEQAAFVAFYCLFTLLRWRIVQRTLADEEAQPRD